MQVRIQHIDLDMGTNKDRDADTAALIAARQATIAAEAALLTGQLRHVGEIPTRLELRIELAPRCAGGYRVTLRLQFADETFAVVGVGTGAGMAIRDAFDTVTDLLAPRIVARPAAAPGPVRGTPTSVGR